LKQVATMLHVNVRWYIQQLWCAREIAVMVTTKSIYVKLSTYTVNRRIYRNTNTNPNPKPNPNHIPNPYIIDLVELLRRLLHKPTADAYKV